VAPVEAFEGCCENASFTAGGGVPPPGEVMVKLVLFAATRFGLVADSVYVPALLRERLLNVAMPFCGVAVSVPVRPVPVASATVTGLVAVVTVFPLLSSTTTVTAGEIVAPVVALEGCCENASFAGGGGVPPPGALMVKPALIADVRFGLAAESVKVPALLAVRLLKVAIPFCGVAVSVPVRPVPPARVRETGLVAVGTGFPLLSSTTTVTAGEIVAPVRALEGCCKNASFTAVAGVPVPDALMLKDELIAGGRLGLVATNV
jgi:hypothetical protein